MFAVFGEACIGYLGYPFQNKQRTSCLENLACDVDKEEKSGVVGGHHQRIFMEQISQVATTAGLAMLGQQIDRYPTLTPLVEYLASTIAVLGSLSTQMERILMFADQLAMEGKYLTSELLTSLDFQKAVTAGARSKRLTDLYERRLLGFQGKNGHERLFIPAWRIERFQTLQFPKPIFLESE